MCRDACVCPRLSAGRLSVQGKRSSGAGVGGVWVWCISVYFGVSGRISVCFCVVLGSLVHWCVGFGVEICIGCLEVFV